MSSVEKACFLRRLLCRVVCMIDINDGLASIVLVGVDTAVHNVAFVFEVVH